MVEIRVFCCCFLLADGVHGIQPQTPCEGVGGIAALPDGVKHLGSCLFADILAAVEHSGNSGDGDASFFGDVIDGHGFSLCKDCPDNLRAV